MRKNYDSSDVTWRDMRRLWCHGWCTSYDSGQKQGCGAGAQTILGGWSRSQKFLDGGVSAGDLGSYSQEKCGASEL